MSEPNAPAPPPSPPALDPPFRGYIETTYDALLVFEAARRGMIPRVTRRLIERERGMVQSGAVFVFDEAESGIKRWTDGLVWSPSRILGNFLVYRETDKRPANAQTSPSMDSPGTTPSRALQATTTMGPPSSYAESSRMAGLHDGPVMSQGAIRQRSGSDSSVMDRQRERQLVGSLTNSYKFKEGGLVKKTMSVQMQGYSQHMISYYTVEDVMSGKLRAPSTIPELSALEISPEYLQKQNFRFPPMIEIGHDGVPRYRGEPEEPMSPPTPISGMSMQSFHAPEYDPYGMQHSRSMTAPMSLMHSPHGHPAHGGHPHMPSGYPHSYFEGAPSQPVPIQRQGSSGALRPGSSSRRYDPYGPASASPRGSLTGMSPVGGGLGAGPGAGAGGRRQSIPHTNAEYYPPPQYDIKPIIHPSGQASYAYQPPATAPGSFNDYYSSAPPGLGPNSHGHAHGHGHGHGPPPGVYPAPTAQSPSYAPTAWHSAPTHAGPSPAAQSRLLPTLGGGSTPRGYPGAGPGADGSVQGQGQGQAEGGATNGHSAGQDEYTFSGAPGGGPSGAATQTGPGTGWAAQDGGAYVPPGSG